MNYDPDIMDMGNCDTNVVAISVEQMEQLEDALARTIIEAADELQR